MKAIAKVIGRLIAVLADTGIIEREKAEWILEPAKEAIEGEDKDEYKQTGNKPSAIEPN